MTTAMTDLQAARKQRDTELIGEYRELVQRTLAGAKVDIEDVDYLLKELNLRDADFASDLQMLKDHRQLTPECDAFKAAEPALAKKMAKLKEKRLAARDRVLHATRHETEALLAERMCGRAWNRQRAREDRLDAILKNQRLFDRGMSDES